MQCRQALAVQVLVFRQAVAREDDRTIPSLGFLESISIQFHRNPLAEVGERLESNVVMEVVDKNPVKAVVVIVGERAIVVFEARDETAGVLSDECEEVGFASVSGPVTIDMWLAECPTLQLPYERLQRIEHRLRKSGHVVLDVLGADRAREARDSCKGLFRGHGLLDVLGEESDGGSGSEHDGCDSVVMHESFDGSASGDVCSDDADGVE